MARRNIIIAPRRARARLRNRRGPTDPVTYLRGVILAASGLLVALPLIADATIGVLKPISNGETGCRVVQVIDGDTIRMWCSSGGTVSARLMGFDTPELFSPACASEAAQALSAKWYLRWALFGADDVRMVREGTDRYDRALVRVFLNGEPLADRMIANGHARAYDGGQRIGWCA